VPFFVDFVETPAHSSPAISLCRLLCCNWQAHKSPQCTWWATGLNRLQFLDCLQSAWSDRLSVTLPGTLPALGT